MLQDVRKRASRIVTLLAIILFAQSGRSQDLSHHFVGLDATFVLLNRSTNQFIRYNADRADQRFAPCSTFKIPNTAILLETGIAPDANYQLKYDRRLQATVPVGPGLHAC